MRRLHIPVGRRVLHGALSRLEPGAGKLARRFLGGRVTVTSPGYPTTRLVLRTYLAGSDWFFSTLIRDLYLNNNK
jgi:hypothetical protein